VTLPRTFWYSWSTLPEPGARPVPTEPFDTHRTEKLLYGPANTASRAPQSHLARLPPYRPLVASNDARDAVAGGNL